MDDTRALVAVWAKGLRVSRKSSEFQRIIPARSEDLSPAEVPLDAVPWAGLLGGLYQASQAALGRQFSLLVGKEHLTVVCAAHSEDGYNRKSAVLVAGTVRIDWKADGLEDLVERVRAQTGRLALTYADVLSGGPDHLEEQLRSGRFLPDRTFSLAKEQKRDASLSMSAVVREIKRWKGVTGVATPCLFDTGANVFCGTRDELQRVRSKTRVDGFMDIARGEIEAVSGSLELWPTSPDATTSTDAGNFGRPGFSNIDRRLERIEQQNYEFSRRQEDMLTLLSDFFRQAFGLSNPSPPPAKEPRDDEDSEPR